MTIKHLEKKRILLLVGLITMLGIAIRPTLLIIFSIVIFYEMYVRNKVRLVNYIYIILGALPFLLAYILYNYQVFGKAMASGYYEIHSRTFDFSHSYLIEILFSDIRGWLVWSPIVILGIAGLSLEVKKKSNLVFLLIIFLYVVVYSFWDYWWGGFSIGQRFLIPLMPIIALGLGQLFAKQSIKLILFTLIIFTFIPFFITLTYKATPLPLLNTKNREDYPRIGNAELYTPIQIINYWYQTYLSAVPTYPSSFLGDSSPLSYFSSGQAFFIDIKKQGEDELMINTYWLNNEVSDSFTKVVIFAGESSQINKNLSISSNNEMFSILDKSQFTPELKKELINSYCPFVAFILKKYEEELIVLSNNYSMSIKDGERLEYDDCVHYTNL